MQRVKDPEERAKLQAKSRRIFLRIALIAMLVFVGGLAATVVIMPKLAIAPDDNLGPCPANAAAADGGSSGGDGAAICNDHGSCSADQTHSHCQCDFSMFEGASCESLSFGFLVGAPTAVFAMLWFLNLGWILRGGGVQPPPTAAEMAHIYEELQMLLVRHPPAVEGSSSPAMLMDSGSPGSGGRARTVALSSRWTSGLGAVFVLVRRAG